MFKIPAKKVRNIERYILQLSNEQCVTYSKTGWLDNFNHASCRSHWKVIHMWRPHTYDRFASHYNAQLSRFNSRFASPGKEAVNAFSQDWNEDNDWICPPPGIILKAIRYMSILMPQELSLCFTGHFVYSGLFFTERFQRFLNICHKCLLTAQDWWLNNSRSYSKSNTEEICLLGISQIRQMLWDLEKLRSIFVVLAKFSRIYDIICLKFNMVVDYLSTAVSLCSS